MQFTDYEFAERQRLGRLIAHPEQRVIVIHGFEVISERLAADSDAVFDDLCRFAKRKGIPFDRVGRVGEFDVVVFLQLPQSRRRERAQPVELFLLVFDTNDERGEHAESVARRRTTIIRVRRDTVSWISCTNHLASLALVDNGEKPVADRREETRR